MVADQQMGESVERFRELLRDDLLAATRALLGWVIEKDGMRAQIVEVEAYGPTDPGCHAFTTGRTARLEAMYGPPGRAYIYFTYGNHWMLNVSVHEDGTPAAILIRAAKPLDGLEEMYARRPSARTERDLLSGPGKLCQAMAIDKTQYGCDLLSGAGPITLRPSVVPSEVLVGTRIGLALGKGDDYPWRFIDAGEREWASKPIPR